MGILDKASFYLPAGAAYKQSEIWAAKPLTDDAKCNFYRDSIATRTTDCGEIGKVNNAIPAYRYRGGVPFLQLESQSTNLILNSEDVSTASYDQATYTSNVVISPAGFINGDLVREGTTTGRHIVYYGINSTNNSTAIYSFSCFVKPAGRRYVVLSSHRANFISGTSLYPSVVFDIQEGVVTDVTAEISAYGIESAGDGWYRIFLTTDSVGSSNGNWVISLSNVDNMDQTLSYGSPVYGGDNTSGIYLFGTQLEQQGVMTSYIKTSGASATRDETKIRNPNTNLWNNASGVLYADIYFYGGGESQLLGLDGGGSVVTRIYVNDTGVIQGHYFESSTYKGNMTHTVGIGRHKIAYKYASGSSKLFIDGVQVGSSSDSFTPQTFSYLRINELWGGYEYGNVDLHEAAVFDQTLNDDELISLTTL
jgi:hypothetical protein